MVLQVSHKSTSYGKKKIRASLKPCHRKSQKDKHVTKKKSTMYHIKSKIYNMIAPKGLDQLHDE